MVENINKKNTDKSCTTWNYKFTVFFYTEKDGLMKLERLCFNSNRFNNSILKSLKGLPSLKTLDLSGNDFHGPLHIQGNIT